MDQSEITKLHAIFQQQQSDHPTGVQKASKSDVEKVDWINHQMVPDVSVITPIYNTERYLDAAISSALEQKGVAVEMILIDDASTDGSLHRARDYASRHKNVKLISLDQNRGPTFARNEGLKCAMGDYIAFLDSDDYFWSNTSLVTVYKEAKKNQSDMVLSHSVNRFEGNGGYISFSEVRREKTIFDRALRETNLEQFPELVLAGSFCAFLYRREFLQKNGLAFFSAQRRWEDRPFYTKCLINAASISCCPVVTRAYRKHQTSTMARYHGIENTKNRGPRDFHMVVSHIRTIENAFRQKSVEKKIESARRLSGVVSVKMALQRVVPDLVVGSWKRESKTALSELANLMSELALNEEDFQYVSRISGKRRYNNVGSREFENYVQLCHGNLTSVWKDISNTPMTITQQTSLGTDTHQLAHTKCQPRNSVNNNTRRTVVIHIGFHKTGSTFLQHKLLQERERLREVGVLIPSTGLVGDRSFDRRRGFRSGGHQEIASASRKCGKLDAYIQELDEEVSRSGSRHIVLTSENFELPFRISRPDLLASALRDYDVKVLVYLRRPDTWLESLYKELVTGGWRKETRTLQEVVITDGQNWVDYVNRLRPWVDSFGTRSVEVRCYEYAMASSGGLWRDFLEGTNLQSKIGNFGVSVNSCETEENRFNVSYGRIYTELVRYFNILNNGNPRYREDLEVLLNILDDANIEDDRMSILPPAMRRELQSGWIEGIEKLAKLGIMSNRTKAEFFDVINMDEDMNWEPLSALPANGMRWVFNQSWDANSLYLNISEKSQSRNQTRVRRMTKPARRFVKRVLKS